MIDKVYCKVDADYSSIEVGDLLTSSVALGHAIKAIDPNKAFGAVIGKAQTIAIYFYSLLNVFRSLNVHTLKNQL